MYFDFHERKYKGVVKELTLQWAAPRKLLGFSVLKIQGITYTKDRDHD